MTTTVPKLAAEQSTGRACRIPGSHPAHVIALVWCLGVLGSFPHSAFADGMLRDRIASQASGSEGVAGTMRTIGAYPQERGVGHTITAFPDGRLLVYGHSPGSFAIDNISTDWQRRTAERNEVPPVTWDPKPGAWRTLENPPECQFSHYLHTATLIANNRVLIAGGYCDGVLKTSTSGVHQPYTALSIWNDQTGRWEAAPSLFEARVYHTAIALADGSVMFVGGLADQPSPNGVEPVLGSVELFTGNQVEKLAPLAVPRARHTATFMPDGTVLVIGGTDAAGKALSSVEMWSPATRTWRQGPALRIPRYRHSATYLDDGRVLVAGGAGPDGLDTASVEILDINRSAWSPGSPLLLPLRRHSALALGNGDVLVTGVNFDGEYSPPRGFSMLWERASGDWRPAGHLEAERYKDVQSFQLASLPGDRQRALVFDFRQVMLWSRAPVGTSVVSAYESRDGYATTILKDGRVMLAGGRHLLRNRVQGVNAFDWAEIFDPATGQFSLTGRLKHPYSEPRALTLDDGRVVVGELAKPWVNRYPRLDHVAEVWNPKTGQWTAINGLATGGYKLLWLENFGKLADGRVLFLFQLETSIVGHALAAVVWDPNTGLAETKAVSAKNRVGPGTVINRDGRVFIFGGSSPNNKAVFWDVEVWDWQTNRATPLPSPPHWRANYVSSLQLRDESIFLLDLSIASQATAATALWNAAQERWQDIPPLPRERDWDNRHLQLLELANGTIVVDNLWWRPGAPAWTPVPRYPQPEARMVVLPDSRLLALSSSPPHAAFFDMDRRQWQMNVSYYLRRTGQSQPVLLELTDGRLMVAGRLAKFDGSGETVAQIWDPKTDTWTAGGRLLGDYGDVAKAILLPSGQVMYLGLDRQGRLLCETGHPADQKWVACDESLPMTGKRDHFDLGRLRDGRIVLKFGGKEVYLYSEQNVQWMLGDADQVARSEPNWNTDRRTTPDGCLVSGLPLNIQNASNGENLIPYAPATGIRERAARVVVLSDGTVVVAGYPEGANDFNAGFFHRKATCAGFEASPDDKVMMVSGFEKPADADPKPQTVVVIPDWNPLANIDSPIPWIALAILFPVLLYFVLRKIIQRVNRADPGQELPLWLTRGIRVVVYGAIGIGILYMIWPRYGSQISSSLTPTDASKSWPCRFVGKWTSTRSGAVFTMTLSDDGRFRTEPIAGRTGVARVYSGRWEIRGDRMAWLYDDANLDTNDINPVRQEANDSFTLIEQNGEYSRFNRVGQLTSGRCKS
jgi:hypothetical protein